MRLRNWLGKPLILQVRQNWKIFIDREPRYVQNICPMYHRTERHYINKQKCSKSSNHNPKCQGIGELSLLDFLEKAEGNKSDLAEKKFVLAGGGTLVCPILTSGGYGADIYYQGTKALTYLGSGYGWACERTPAEREKKKSFMEFILMSIIP